MVGRRIFWPASADKTAENAHRVGELGKMLGAFEWIEDVDDKGSSHRFLRDEQIDSALMEDLLQHTDT